MPTLPDSVTATWCHAPVLSADVPSMRCSPPEPLVVIAKRMEPEPLCGVRNMFAVVPVPKSNTRRHALVEVSLTHVATVKSLSPLTTPVGKATCWLVPLRLTALPTRPAANVAPLTSVAVRPPPDASAAVVPLVSSKWYCVTGPAAPPSLSVIVACVVPGVIDTVVPDASSVPPVTLATPTLLKIGSWTSTAPPGSVPDSVTVSTRCAAGLLTATDTPYVVRAPELTSCALIRLLAPIVCPGCTHASG